MSKHKLPDMSAFMNSALGDQKHAVQTAIEAPKLTEDSKPQRGRGRPSKAPEDLAKQTAIRIDTDDLKKIKKLAVDDGMTFNRVVYLALEAYCETRGVKLLGASKK